MARLALWLAANRVRRVVFIAGLFPLPLLSLLSAATVVMAAQLRGPREALQECLLALVLLAGLALVTGMDPRLLAASAALSWLVWLLLGTLAGATGSLTLAVQVAVMLTLAAFGLFVGLVGDVVAWWVTVLDAIYKDLAEQGVAVTVDVAEQAALMSGVVAAGSLTGSVAALLLGSAWASSVRTGQYGSQFRALNLGYFVGGLAALAGIAGLLGLQMYGLLLVFGAAFMFQGMAVAAWWSNRLEWPRGWWIGLCIVPFLLPDLLIVVAVLFASIGFVDNWYGLRRAPEGA